MPKFEVIEVSKYAKTKFRDGNPYTLTFVHTPSGNYLVKGQARTVDEYIKEHFPQCIYKNTYWHKGKARGYWRADQNHSLYIKKVYDRTSKHYGRFEVMMYVVGSMTPKVYYFKRMPSKWLPIFEQASLSRSYSEFFDKEQKRLTDLKRQPLKTGNTDLPTGVKKDKNGLRML